MKRINIMIAILMVIAGFAVASGNGNVASQDQEATSLHLTSVVIDAEYLIDNLSADNLVILDTARKKEEYDAGHLPEALFAEQTGYYQEVEGIPGMFPGVESTVAWLEELGVSNESAVVIYDKGPGLWAARLAWTLAYLGHENWAVLDGGYGLWEASGLEVTSHEPKKPNRGILTPDVQEQLLATGDDVLTSLSDPNYVVIDTRSPGEYDGSDVRADRGGHIPGAVSLEWTLNNAGGSLPELLGADELAEFYGSKGVDPEQKVITHCQTGVRGAHTWLALTLAGYEDVVLYDGSWIEWANNEKYPVELP